MVFAFNGSASQSALRCKAVLEMLTVISFSVISSKLGNGGNTVTWARPRTGHRGGSGDRLVAEGLFTSALHILCRDVWVWFFKFVQKSGMGIQVLPL